MHLQSNISVFVYIRNTESDDNAMYVQSYRQYMWDLKMPLLLLRTLRSARTLYAQIRALASRKEMHDTLAIEYLSVFLRVCCIHPSILPSSHHQHIATKKVSSRTHVFLFFVCSCVTSLFYWPRVPCSIRVLFVEPPNILPVSVSNARWIQTLPNSYWMSRH